jgi:adenylosuccinate synthase
MLRLAVPLNTSTVLALRQLDVLDSFERIKVCTGYRVGGSLLPSYPDRMELLAEVEPVYAELPGWRRPVSSAREAGELPREAADLVALVEAQVGVPVNVVGVGAERDDYLIWSPR